MNPVTLQDLLQEAERQPAEAVEVFAKMLTFANAYHQHVSTLTIDEKIEVLEAVETAQDVLRDLQDDVAELLNE